MSRHFTLLPLLGAEQTLLVFIQFYSKNFKTSGCEICDFSQQFAPKASYFTAEFICH